MSELTHEWMESEADRLIEIFADGFQYSDLFQLILMALRAVDRSSEATMDEKKQTAVQIVNIVIDKTDMPWIPDSMVDPILKEIVPHAIDALIQVATNGLGGAQEE